MEYKIIGDTSNMLFLDDRVYGVFITLKAMNKIALCEEDNVIEAEAGAMLPELSRKALLWDVLALKVWRVFRVRWEEVSL